MCPDAIPILGSLIPFAKMDQVRLKNGNNLSTSDYYFFDHVKLTDEPAFVCWLCNDPNVLIADCEIVQAMFTTQNAAFSKHPLIKDLCLRMLGDGILLASTNAVWRNRRHAISPAFYKGKLIGLLELAKGCVA